MGNGNVYRDITAALGIVSVPEQEARGVRLWPNPVDGQLRIALPMDCAKARIIISDMTGRVAGSELLPGTEILSIDASALASGCYQVRIEADEAWYTARFVKR